MESMAMVVSVGLRIKRKSNFAVLLLTSANAYDVQQTIFRQVLYYI